MSTVSRKLITLDMLREDLSEEDIPVEGVPDSYLKLLEQYLSECRALLFLAGDLKDGVFVDIVATSGTCLHITNKRMLKVQIRLLEYVLAYYDATHKAEKIQAFEFDSQADRRLDLLQTKAIKARSQFKTVAQAMGPSDLQELIDATCLPEFDWSWKALGLTSPSSG